MNNIRKHLHANAVGYIALFLALGTSTAWAATELSRNSVKSKHIVNQQVKSIDLENGTIKGKDVGANQLGGAQIAESTLGVVPDADRVDGIDAGSFRYSADADADPAPIELFSVGPLKVDLTCADVFSTASFLRLGATSTRAGAAIRLISAREDGDSAVESTGVESMDANQSYGELAVAVSEGAPAMAQVSLTYFAPGARLGERFVSADLLLLTDRVTGDDCRAVGTYLTDSF